tara:strand:- start:83 stop:1318 length:1236 start_codon:yes stop_codon:yes gene_type:complete
MTIIFRDIAPSPNKYEAYLYRFENANDGKLYIGYHLGAVNDTYQHSSTNDEFNEAFQSSDAEFYFDVLDYGDQRVMIHEENKLLTKVDARNNPLYYNKTNGQKGGYDDIDEDSCVALVEQIRSGQYQIVKEDISIHEQMDYLQVRFQHDDSLQKIIRQKIDDALGNTDKCNPVIVFEKRGAAGEDLRIDGNHTVWGAAASKHATKIPAIRIPYDVNRHYSDSEIRTIGNLLNARADIIKEPIKQADGIKYVLDNAAQGVPFNATQNVKLLQRFGFTGSVGKGEIKTILDKAKQIIDKDEALKHHGDLFINYKAAPHSTTLKSKVEQLNYEKGICSLYMSSKKFSIERILETLYAGDSVGNKTCIVVVHHPTVEYGKKWKQDIQPYWLKIIDKFICNVDIQFEEMPMWTKQS